MILCLVWLFLGVLLLNTPHLHSSGNTHSHAHWPQVMKSLTTRMIKAGAIQACCFYFHSSYILTRFSFCTIRRMFPFIENIHRRTKDFLQIMGVNCDLRSWCENPLPLNPSHVRNNSERYLSGLFKYTNFKHFPSNQISLPVCITIVESHFQIGTNILYITPASN